MCLSSPFVFIYIRLFPLKSNTPFTQIACFSAGLRHAASVAKAADSLGGAPGFQVAGRQVGSAAPPQTPAPPPTIEDGAQRFLGGGKRVRSLVTVKLKARERQCGGRDGSACGCERPPHSRTLTPTDARALTHAHAHSHPPAYTTHVLTAHSHPPTCSHVHTLTHTRPLHTPHTPSHTRLHTHTRTHVRTMHTHTYSHTHAHSHSHTPMRRDDSVNVHGDKACWGDGNSSWQLGDPRRCCAWRFGVWFWGLQACRVPDA